MQCPVPDQLPVVSQTTLSVCYNIARTVVLQQLEWLCAFTNRGCASPVQAQTMSMSTMLEHKSEWDFYGTLQEN